MHIQMDRESGVSLQDQIKNGIRLSIAQGRLRSGERLPPSRKLSEALCVHRGTVTAAYAELVEEGVLDGHVGRGTFVARVASSVPSGVEPEQIPFRWQEHFAGPEFPAREGASTTATSREDVINFARYLPDAALFPLAAFRRALDEVFQEDGGALLSYGPPEGHPALLAFLRRHLADTRGVRAGENELLAVNGSQQAMDLLARAFLRPGDTVLVEEPTYWGVLELMRSYGARFVGVPVDAQGMRVEAAEAVLARERPKLIYIMPSFQNPTGTCLAEERRDALLRLVRRYQVPLIEDDFDGEIYFDAPPPAPLKSRPGSEGVIYIGTPSKMLFPGLRIGWVAAPPVVVRRLSRLKQSADLSGSPLLQAALARFAAHGELERHTAVIRRAYAERRRCLVRALGRHMPEGVTWTDPQGGLSLLVTLPEGLDTTALLEDAAQEGVLYSPGRLFFLKDGARHLRLGFGSVPDADIEDGVKRLARVVRRALAQSPHAATPDGRLVLPPV